MSGSPLTVPPPRDDDHDDVAWALRAASAQWKRDAAEDAVGWVRRAAETAVEVGAIDRAAELVQLANTLARGPVAVAPPPPTGARPRRGSIADIEVEMQDMDLDDLDTEGVQEVTDDDDIVFGDVGDSLAPAQSVAPPSAPLPSVPPASVPPASVPLPSVPPPSVPPPSLPAPRVPSVPAPRTPQVPGARMPAAPAAAQSRTETSKR